MDNLPQENRTYIGRFAPTPSGPLHFGSLVAALASYLDARHHKGKWLVRMEDLDPPREVPGAANTILKQLTAHGLIWDDDVLYQSKRNSAYQVAVQQLQAQQQAYPCDCSRQQIRDMGGIYNGHCRTRNPLPKGSVACRVSTQANASIQFDDLFQGEQQWDLPITAGDFIIRRRDRLFAYQLACAVDDLHQNITHIVRGSDLIDSTPRQIYLMTLLNQPTTTPQPASLPIYGHIPVAINPGGQKLSKQNLAQAIDSNDAPDNLRTALAWLNHTPPEAFDAANPEQLLAWASQEWDRSKIPGVLAIPAPPSHSD